MPKSIRDNTNKRKGPYEKQGVKVQERVVVQIDAWIVYKYILPNEDKGRIDQFEVKQGTKEDAVDCKHYETKENAKKAKLDYEKHGLPDFAFSPVVSPRLDSPVGPLLITPNQPYNWRNPDLNPPIWLPCAPVCPLYL